MQGLTLLQKSIAKDRRPLSWVVDDQGVRQVQKPGLKPSQRDLLRGERMRADKLRPVDTV
jgi:NADH-quinone oxidoreductase subunit B